MSGVYTGNEEIIMSIVEIAKLAGVSHTTVSRVVNNEGNVRPETAIKVRSVMKKIGYIPKPPSMRRGPRRTKDVGFKTGNIAFLASSDNLKVLSNSPVMHDVVHGIEEALAFHGMSMVQGAVSSKRQLPPIVSRGEVDGVIVWPNLDGVPAETVEILRQYKIVYVMSANEERLPGDRVKNNNSTIGQLAAKHLISRGHDAIAYITPSSLTSTINLCERWSAFSSLACRKGTEPRQVIIEQSHLDLLEINKDRDLLIQKAMEDLFAIDKRPTGIFVTCDALTAKIYSILKKIGIEIDGDIEIISCNNEISLLAGLEPRPLSIDIQPELIGKRAVEQLRWRIMHPEDETQITIEIQPRLI